MAALSVPFRTTDDTVLAQWPALWRVSASALSPHPRQPLRVPDRTPHTLPLTAITPRLTARYGEPACHRALPHLTRRVKRLRPVRHPCYP